MGALRVISGNIEQEELDAIVAIDNQIAALRHLRDRRCNAILDRLMSGAKVDPGANFAAIAESSHGVTRIFKLLLNGRVLR